MKITVFHTPISGHGDSSQFQGPELDYRVEENGGLRVVKWTTAGETGDALFAPGAWSLVFRARPLSA